jgi:uncharacterized protein YciI
MYVFVHVRYLVPIEQIDKTLEAHRAYLRSLKEERKLLVSGPLVPRTGGGLLLRVNDEAELSQLLANDPFCKEGLVEHTIFRWAPVIGADGLDGL